MTDPAVGALGVVGCVLTTMLVLALDVHPSVLVTVNVYVAPAAAVTTPLPSTVGPVGLNV